MIPAFGMLSVVAFMYLEKYKDKSADDWLHTNKKMFHEILYIVSRYGTAISAAFGFIGYGLITWVGLGGFPVFEIPPFFEFQFVVLMSTLIWSQIRQEYTHALFERVVEEIPWILDDEETMNRAKEIIMKVQGKMENLGAIIQEVKLELESTNKELEALEKEKKERQENLSKMRQQIEQNNRDIQKIMDANDNLVQPLKDAKALMKETKFALDEATAEFSKLQKMLQHYNDSTKNMQDDVDAVDLEIEDAFREISTQWAQQLQEFDEQYIAARSNEKKLRRYMLEIPVLERKNEFLKELIDKQVKELPLASRQKIDLEVRDFKRKRLQDYLICQVCKQPKKDGCTCGGSGPLFSS